MLRLLQIAIVLGAVHFAWKQWHEPVSEQQRLDAQSLDADDIRGLAERVGAGEVVMYVTETCPYCHQFEGWMDEHGFAYSKCDIEKDRSCYADYQRYRALGTPHTVVRRKGELLQVSGFDAQEFLTAVIATDPVPPR